MSDHLHIEIEGMSEALGMLMGINQAQNAILEKLDEILGKEDKIMSALDDLTAQVAADTTVIQSAVTLINGIAAQIAAAGTDPTKLAALTASLKANDDSLAAAVTANTPAA